MRWLSPDVAKLLKLFALGHYRLESQGIALLLRGGIQGPFLQLPDVSAHLPSWSVNDF